MKLYFVDHLLFTETNLELMMRLSYLIKVRKVEHLFLNGKVDDIAMKVLNTHEECNLYFGKEYHIGESHIIVEDDLVTVNKQQSPLYPESVLVYDSDNQSFTNIYLNLFLNHSISESFIDHFVKQLQDALQDNLGNVTVKKLK